MRKVFSLMLLLATILTFTACGDDKEDEPSVSLNGTTWTASYVDELFVLEFESSNKVIGYRADSNGNIKGNVFTSTYSINGDRITFGNNFYITNFYKFYFTDGTIVGNTMTLNYWWEMGAPGDKQRFDDTKTFRKK